MKLCQIILILFLFKTNFGYSQAIPLEKFGIKDYSPDEIKSFGNVKTIKLYKELAIKSVEEINLKRDDKKFKLAAVYNLSKSKKLVSRANYYDGKYEGRTSYFYQKDSIPLGSITISAPDFDKPYRDTAFTYFQYDDKMRLIENVSFGVNRHYLSSLDSYKYQPKSDGFEVKKTNYGGDSLLLFIHQRTFDKYGNEITMEGFPIDDFDNKDFFAKITSDYIKIGEKYYLKRKFEDGGHYQHIYEYAYDNLGRVIEENEPSTIKKYVYGKDYYEIYEDNYAYGKDFGYSKYDKWGNLVFKGYMNKDSKVIRNDFYHSKFKYEYDTQGNWIAKYEFSKEDPSIIEHLKSVTIREIDYYKEGEKSLSYEMPNQKLVNLAISAAKYIPEYSQEKHNKILAYKKAVKEGKYGKEITVKKSKNISDFTPKLWKIEQEIDGDILGDSTSEKVVVYSKPNQSDDEEQSCLAIFQKNESEWELKGQYFNLVSSSDLFDDKSSVNIERKSLVISNDGVRGVNWNNTYRFRFQNDDFYLIGVTIFWGKCEETSNFDYNLNTGKIEYNHTFEDCSQEQNEKPPKSFSRKFYRKLEKLPLMKDFKKGENKVEISKGEMIYY